MNHLTILGVDFASVGHNGGSFTHPVQLFVYLKRKRDVKRVPLFYQGATVVSSVSGSFNPVKNEFTQQLISK